MKSEKEHKIDASVVAQGKKLVSSYGCMNCHQIPGLLGNPENIGPSLKNWSKRKMIAGKLENNRKNLNKWILKTHSVERNTAMPQLKISEKHSKKITEFLFSL
jgi:cytochrome c551/c552